MRILLFGGGLGNQIFEYAFYLYLKEKFPAEKIWGLYNKNWLREHNGLEIDKVFDVRLPRSCWWVNFLVAGLYLIKQIFPQNEFFDLGRRECNNLNAIYFNSFKFSKKYIPAGNDWLQLKKITMDEKNQDILNMIKKNNSVFIHIRRGDYLSPKYKAQFSGCCTLEYYQEAIKKICITYSDPVFFIFSDDMLWVKENLIFSCSIPVYIDWNTGENSFKDMLLMSYCQGGIIANSTFSYWAAKLYQKKTIIYPLNWFNPTLLNQPDIFPDEWIGI